MFDDPKNKPAVYSAPQSVTSLIAAILEPALAVVCFLAVSLGFDEPIVRSDLVFCLLLFAFNFPGRNRFQERPLNAFVGISVSWLTLLLVLALCGWATKSLVLFDPDVLLTWALLTPTLQWFAFFFGRKLQRWWWAQPQNRRNAVVIGAGPLGLKMARALQAPGSGADFAGYFDDRSDERVHGEAAPRQLGTLAEAAPWIREHGVHEVYITLPLGSQPRIVKLLERLQATAASIYFVPDVFGISIVQGRLRDLDGVPVVGICDTPFVGANEVVKRLSDILLASAILVLIAPVMLVIALGVKLESPGPVIFKQRRNGLMGEQITVWKFRTMRALDDGAVVRQATRDDPRVTKFGAFLRRSSLDELPQFFNVLQGQMSIVGPRPHAVAHNEMYRKLIKAYMVRHKVKPGITGWAQVHGHRGETDTLDKMQARVEYDLEYLRNWSLLLDLQIIARTIKLVFFDRQAY
jgi:putative colanic acid biosynthesis UDP-glucose lipid carrier transferase